MILYHSSTVEVKEPDTTHSRLYLDFGKGFYLTSIHEQAVRYAERFLRRKRIAWLNTYELKDNLEGWKILYLESYDKQWLDFVSACRAGNDTSDYDMVVGGIADDRVILTLDRYFQGELTQEQALGLLKYERPNIQYCIQSEQMLKQCLTFISSEQL
ncbi:MAG: DUF3990 domain-containing protein [Muribaculaceae bacterium]|nr:DUF3990 domain-containing protein [Muribaculaceae bacterium]